jgi:hypothetical protein
VPWKSYASGKNHYAIKYPPTWIVTPATPGYTDKFDNNGYPYVFVDRDTASAGHVVDVGRTVTRIIADTKSHQKAKVTSNKPITLAGGYKGRIVTFDGMDEGVHVTIQSIVVGKGKVAYFLDLWAAVETAPSDMKTFRTMYLSWRPK